MALKFNDLFCLLFQIVKAIDSKDACGAGYPRGGPLIVKLKCWC